MPEKFPSFVIEFAESLLSVAKHGGRRSALKLNTLLNDKLFEMISFKRVTELITDCEKVSIKLKNVMKKDLFERVLVGESSAKKE